MITPSSVRNARILWRTSAEEETRKSSATVTAGLRRLRSGSPLLLLVLPVHDDLVPFLDLSQHLEGPGDDLLPDRGPLLDLDHELACEAGLDLLELELAVLDDVDALLGLRPSGGALLGVLLRHVPDDERLDGDRGRAVVLAGHDLGGDRETGADRLGRILDADLDLEVDRLGVGGQRQQIRIVLRDRRGADLGDGSLELLARVG